ncbi:MAG: hypothetical protein HYU99_01280 [Deltaproteobacteria bacterium]|nr:hypothetical protein [Deltaproteobacteria bacterium]
MPGFSPFPLFGSLIACPPKGGAPGLDPGGNAPESGNFEEWVAGMVRQIPPAGSHGFVPPTEEQLARWRDLFTAFTNRDWPAVSTSLDYFGNYRLIFFNDEATNEVYSILADTGRQRTGH